MPVTLYCWRCNADAPMLTEDEWVVIAPLMARAVPDSQAFFEAYRKEHGVPLRGEPEHPLGEAALAKYFEKTGCAETNFNALWHHCASQYGPPCRICGKPLRTPQARFCAACGALRPIPRAKA